MSQTHTAVLAALTALIGVKELINETTGETPNAQRAAWALAAVDTFAKLTYGRRGFDTLAASAEGELHDDAATCLYDLICDALHLGAALGYDPHELARLGLANFTDEHAQEAA